jgi:hypothetical protein
MRRHAVMGAGAGNHLVFNFLTTDASHDVPPVHSDATPVLLLTEDEREMRMTAPMEMALSLQRPPSPGSLKVMATDTKQDDAPWITLKRQPTRFPLDLGGAQKMHTRLGTSHRLPG